MEAARQIAEGLGVGVSVGVTSGKLGGFADEDMVKELIVDRGVLE